MIGSPTMNAGWREYCRVVKERQWKAWALVGSRIPGMQGIEHKMAGKGMPPEYLLTWEAV